MITFNDFIREKGLFSILKDLYDITSLSENQEDLLLLVFNKIMNTEFDDSTPNHIDLIGDIYEKTVDLEYRKNFGEFYTPRVIVNHILESIGYTYNNIIRHKKIIDISCGAGSFLIVSSKTLKKSLLISYQNQELKDISIETVKKILAEIRNNIFGIDLNPIACILCQLNLFLSVFDIIRVIYEKEPNYQLECFNIKNINALSLSNEEEYDYIVGNPPYLFIRDITRQHRQMIEKSNLETNIGQYDYYQIFIEIGLNILKDHGSLGYIIPDSILALSNRRIIRKYVYEHSKIREICIVGSQFEDPVVSNVILILKKEKDGNKRMENLISIKEMNGDRHSTRELNQKLIEKFDFKFQIYLNAIDVKIIDHLNENFPKLGNLMNDASYHIILSRGIELGKGGKIVYCQVCQKYFPIPKKELICPVCRNLINLESLETIITDEIPLEGGLDYQKFLFSMNRYKVNEIKYINIKKNGINYKNNRLYKDRIIIRQLNQNKLICATYDSNLLTSQSFYNLRILKSDIKEFNNYYLLGLINSHLLSYYYCKTFSSYKKLFPRILIEKIKNLPIKVPQTEHEKKCSREIISLVKKILMNPDDLINSENQINSLVFDLYEISEEKRRYISQEFKVS